MIRSANLSKGYSDGGNRVEVLQSLSLTLASGTSLAVTGPSGSGKSTLLNLIAGALEAEAGQVHVDVEQAEQTFALEQMNKAARTRFRRRWVGYVHQFFNLIPTLTVRENGNGIHLRLVNRLSQLRHFSDHIGGEQEQDEH